MKIKLDEKSPVYDQKLYKSAIYLPNFLTIGWALEAGSVAGMLIDGNPNSIFFTICAIYALFVGIILLGVTFYAIVEKITTPWYLRVLIGAKPTPYMFNGIYLNHPYYQEALKEYYAGKDIGSMQPLNDELKLLAEHERSGVVNELARKAKMEREIMDEVKAIGKID